MTFNHEDSVDIWLDAANREVGAAVGAFLDVESALGQVKQHAADTHLRAVRYVQHEVVQDRELALVGAQLSRAIRAPVVVNDRHLLDHMDSAAALRPIDGLRVVPPVSDLTVLVADAIAGERSAVEHLLAMVRPLMVRYCRARIGRRERSFASADDVAQEVCLAVLTALPSYRHQGRPFLAFAYGIAAHKVANAYRAAAQGAAVPITDVPATAAESRQTQPAMRAELTTRLAQLLSVLPAKQREILVLRVVVGLSAEETAEAVGSTPGAVRVAQHRALARLRAAAPNWDIA